MATAPNTSIAKWQLKLPYIASTLVEHLLFAVSLFFIIPPVPSMEGERYYFGGAALAWMLLFLCASRYLAMRRGEESWLGLLLKAAILAVAGFVNFERVFF